MGKGAWKDDRDGKEWGRKGTVIKVCEEIEEISVRWRQE